jgi:agmatine/peptidylarginine deiminase
MAPTGKYIYPADTSRHLATILGFPSKCSIASAYYQDACQEIVNLAATIAPFEPVRLYARPEDVAKAQSMVDQAVEPVQASNVAVIPLPTNHLWVRDTGPVYVRGTSENSRLQRFAISFRFSEWGKKGEINDHDRAPDGLNWPAMTPAQLEENETFAQRVIATDALPSPVVLVESKIRLEGGALVVDGEGTLLATESSILNANRNSGLSRAAIEEELQRLLGIDKIIWFPGRRDLDVTDVHVDAELNFVRPGIVVLSRPHPSAPRPWMEVYDEIREILQHEVDAKGRRFEVHIIDEPDPTCLPSTYEDPATNYVNFYFVNGGLIVPQFGDPPRDQAALATLQTLCPDREVRQLQVRALPLAGGVIHCATQPVIAVKVN